METKPRTTKPFVAAVLAAGLFLAGGSLFRSLSATLGRPAGEATLDSEALAIFPTTLGEWHGREHPLEESVIRATDSDAHISRVYVAGNKAVTLWVAYGVRSRDLMPHRPEVCYPGAGWVAQGHSDWAIPMPDGTSIPCRIYRFERGGLDSASVLVLNYYIIDGRFSPDVSALRAQAARGGKGPRYVVQVEITAADRGHLTTGWGRDSVTEFATLAAPPLHALFPGFEDVSDDAGRTSVTVADAAARRRPGGVDHE